MENTTLTYKKKIVAMAPYDRGWSNVAFLKECGLIPYLLYKNHNCDVTFVGAKREEWPYLEHHLKGVKTDILPTGTVDEKIAYIREHAYVAAKYNFTGIKCNCLALKEKLLIKHVNHK